MFNVDSIYGPIRLPSPQTMYLQAGDVEEWDAVHTDVVLGRVDGHRTLVHQATPTEHPSLHLLPSSPSFFV
ncbi:hypothetical protein A0H81_13820 [Grifola frondosa]|uniref:Uncharacterized protein n=1 Tax=Grifola frondosa TaxID=5627 RepID=A0A1C7LTP2_GRIFR|nr:hypothetical protein A0H81_13820 [Grifola frondosa]